MSDRTFFSETVFQFGEMEKIKKKGIKKKENESERKFEVKLVFLYTLQTPVTWIDTYILGCFFSSGQTFRKFVGIFVKKFVFDVFLLNRG